MAMKTSKTKNCFNSSQLSIVQQAVSISEDVVNDHFTLTLSTWKKYRYDILTLKDLAKSEITPHAFAQIMRYSRPAPPEGLRHRDFYRICLQDHNILEAKKREAKLDLLPLLTYIVTHELVHIIRFYRYDQGFVATEKAQAEEEALVHRLTYEMLRPVKLSELDVVLKYYASHREMVY